ncbi:MAG: phosphatidate cytidylyltransferase [Alphaproteobacteria bacterium]|nr:phosphatidate cytidylyltransferase [Alphaproteobacteria bacterium]
MLKKRILSALVLIPIPLLALYFGSPWIEILMCAILGIMGWEWETMVTKKFTPVGMTIAITGVVCVYMMMYAPIITLALPIVIALVFLALHKTISAPKMMILGLFYTVYPILSFLMLNYLGGFALGIWLLGLVWAMDTGAYAFGKTIGGPKFAPRISPKKTWAGFIGGMICSGLWGYACTKFISVENSLNFSLITAALGGVSQFGDLFESAIKRKLEIKDSSNLIPGHGGIFDRIDALLGVAPVVVLLFIISAIYNINMGIPFFAIDG